MRGPLGILVLLGSIFAAVAVNAVPAPVSLKTEKDLTSWEFVAVPPTAVAAVCHLTTEGNIAVSGKPIGYLCTKGSFDNYRLHAEWRWPADAVKNSNSGVLLHIASGPKDRAWPECFQVQTKPTRTGDLLPMAGATFAEKLSTPPGVKNPQLDHRADTVEKPLGEWNTCDITCRDGTIEIVINGVLANRVSNATPGAGKVGFQCEGTPYELRNVTLTPLD
jgi:hypothetical protein